MNRIYMGGGGTLVALAVLLAACGGGGGGGTKTPAAATSRIASSPTMSGPNTGPGGARATSTPIPTVAADDASATGVAARATATALAVEDLIGGDPSGTPQIVVAIPPVTPRSGTNPVVDSTQIAAPDPSVNGLAYIVDLDASAPGVQATRDVNRGDVFQVAVVLANIPPNENNIGGIASFNFILNYDKRKIVAPTISGGPETNRNPKLNVAALGGDAAGWLCEPAPEGDIDDPIGIEGDGIPETGQALISCFNGGYAESSGTIVLATVQFTAVAEGSTELKLTNVAAADGVGIEFATCADDSVTGVVPCMTGTVAVK